MPCPHTLRCAVEIDASERTANKPRTRQTQLHAHTHIPHNDKKIDSANLSKVRYYVGLSRHKTRLICHPKQQLLAQYSIGYNLSGTVGYRNCIYDTFAVSFHCFLTTEHYDIYITVKITEIIRSIKPVCKKSQWRSGNLIFVISFLGGPEGCCLQRLTQAQESVPWDGQLGTICNCITVLYHPRSYDTASDIVRPFFIPDSDSTVTFSTSYSHRLVHIPDSLQGLGNVHPTAVCFVIMFGFVP